MTDEKIIELYFKRHEDAIVQSEKKYGVYCFSIAERILNDRGSAEECVSDTWLHAWQAIPPQRPTVLRLFFARITRNLSIDLFRKRSAEKRGSGEIIIALDELSECLSERKNTEQEMEEKELACILNRFFQTLKERERNVFLRRYFFLESTSAIAKQYKLSEANTLVILSRVRKKLKEHLQKEGYCI